VARTNATNFSGGLQFPYATAANDVFKKEDVQVLAQAVDQHTHAAGLGHQLAAGAIPNGSITSAMIADGTIVAGDIADGTITSVKIADGTITGADIATNTIPGGCIVVASINGDRIADNQITSAKIADGTLTATDMAAGAAAANVGALGGVLSGTLPNPSFAPNSVNSVIYDGSASSDIWNNSAMSAGYNPVSGYPILVTIPAGTVGCWVTLALSIWFSGGFNVIGQWALAIQNSPQFKLVTQYLPTTPGGYVSCTSTVWVPASAWGGGSGGRQFGPQFWINGAVASGFSLRAATQAQSEYIRQTVIAVAA
jgi:hypothetical protein